MICTESYIWPDGKTILCSAWTKGNTDYLTFKIQKEQVREMYRDIPLTEAIQKYAARKFIIFHDINYIETRRSWSKRKSI